MSVRIEIFGEDAHAALEDLYRLTVAMNIANNSNIMKQLAEMPASAPYGKYDPAVEQPESDAPQGTEEQPTEKKRRGRPAKNKDTGTTEPSPETPAEPTATSQTVTEAESDQIDTSTEEDDEFAAFAAATAALSDKESEAAASVPARKWTDADLGALCNQAAVKLGNPQPVKDIIAKYVPEGQVPHSRNIPDDVRADFAAEVEAVAGIEFAG